jgi:multidrug resistance protein MdtO
MASTGQALPANPAKSSLDQSLRWFRGFLTIELSPYPGRAWVVARMTIAATIVMLLVMTFRLPGGFLGAIFTLFLSRENPTATMRAGVRVVIAFVVATAYTVIGITLFVDNPLTHFLWILVTLFVAFYLIRIIPDYGTAVGFGFMIAGAIPLWDEITLSVNTRVENTLWTAFAVMVGTAVTIAVEYIFRRVHPTTDLVEGIETRLQTVESLLRMLGADEPVNADLQKRISLYSGAGTSRLRRILYRSGFGAHFISQMNAAVALLGRLVDLAASLNTLKAEKVITSTGEDRERCDRLADAIAGLQRDLKLQAVPRKINLPSPGGSTSLPFLPQMERTVALIPEAFAGSESIREFIPAPIDDEVREHYFAPDAFSNPDHIRFALRGMLAASACYVVYTAIDWRGLSTSIATCIITALSTIGASRQKQFLRFTGTVIGGIFFGMGAQIFVLPYLNSIAGFTVLFAVVTGIAAWIATSSPRLSYLGVQLALAFYLINLQEFAIQTSLAIARDRIFGVLLGLLAMWLIFDRLWTKDALNQVQTLFSATLEMFAELTEQLLKDDPNEVIKRIRRLRDQLNANFDAIASQLDAILFEFGPSRERKLKIRDDIRRWLPSLRTLLLVQVTSSQYRLQRPISSLPPSLAKAHVAFESDVAQTMRAMADEVNKEVHVDSPDIQASASRLRNEILRGSVDGQPISSQASDVASISETVASILVPLSQDIHATFAATLSTRNALPPPGHNAFPSITG